MCACVSATERDFGQQCLQSRPKAPGLLSSPKLLSQGPRELVVFTGPCSLQFPAIWAEVLLSGLVQHLQLLLTNGTGETESALIIYHHKLQISLKKAALSMASGSPGWGRQGAGSPGRSGFRCMELCSACFKGVNPQCPQAMVSFLSHAARSWPCALFMPFTSRACLSCIVPRDSRNVSETVRGIRDQELFSAALGFCRWTCQLHACMIDNGHDEVLVTSQKWP